MNTNSMKSVISNRPTTLKAGGIREVGKVKPLKNMAMKTTKSPNKGTTRQSY